MFRGENGEPGDRDRVIGGEGDPATQHRDREHPDGDAG
jgi:hypothetical protein